MPAILDGDRIVPRVRTLPAAAERFCVPVTVIEQYPKSLGPTVPAVVAALPPATPVLAKTAFSAAGGAGTMERVSGLRSEGRDQVVLCGVESHVCVLQTALGLKSAGLHVFVVGD